MSEVPQSVRDAAAEIARFAYGNWSALPGDLASGRLTRHFLLDAIAKAYAAGMQEAAEIADAEGDDIERHADLARDPWQVGRLGMARAIGAGIRERIATSAGGGARAALAPASSEGEE